MMQTMDQTINNLTIRPIRNNVLVKPCKNDDISVNGIIVPDSFKERSSKAEIISVGNGTKQRPMKFKNGTICWHIKGAGDEIIINGEKHYLMPDNEILGILVK